MDRSAQLLGCLIECVHVIFATLRPTVHLRSFSSIALRIPYCAQFHTWLARAH